MKKNILVAIVLAATFPTATLVPAASALAEDKRVIEEILVVAPRITREREERVGATQVLTVERDEAVNLEDLDLSRTVDVRKLEQRIAEAARRICEELANEYPFGEPSTPVCIRRAIEDAMAQVDEAVDEAIRR
ncbi:UrcA family protein [Haliea sp. E1-2-M8]|uniref:UrcA family protein n=1 Tax=Haliea sp. E1-2-M8 TaxID=3064706 RepID=UPI00272510C9|nr:UrcA family protein [Haliea sp. E1-2-M8]MDO8863679.1 UrcA family protein [Haliea sp. E1-2-M8]